MTFEDANRTIREAVAARMATTPADDPKMVGYQPPECPGCEGHPFRAKAIGVAAAHAAAIDLAALALPQDFVDANKHVTFRPATPTPPAEFKIERIGSTMSPEQLEAAWAGIKARREEAVRRMRGEGEPVRVETILPAGLEPKRITTTLIGITGPAGCGKNLVASMVPDAVVIQLADPLYAALSVMLGIPEAMLRSRAFKEQKIEWLGQSPRQMLQTLGTEWGRGMVSDRIWLTLAARRIDALEHGGTPAVVIADVRFDNEAELIRSRGGEVWLVDRRPESATTEHVSEAGIARSLINRVIDNTGTPEQTRAALRAALAR